LIGSATAILPADDRRADGAIPVALCLWHPAATRCT